MGQFKPMTKMMTTEPSVELKLKKGGGVKKGVKMQMGGVPPGMPAGMPPGPMGAGRAPLAQRLRRRPMPGLMQAPGAAQGPMIPAAPAPAEPQVMKKGGMTLKKHADMPASKAHKGLKTGGVPMGAGGYAKGGVPKSGILPESESERGAKGYAKTKMDTTHKDKAKGPTGGVKMGAAGYNTGGVVMGQGGYKKGGKARRMADGGASSLGGMIGEVPDKMSVGSQGGGGAFGGLGKIRGAAQDVESGLTAAQSAIGSSSAASPDSLVMKKGGKAKKMMGGGMVYKKGGATKKHYATGGLVDSGKPVAMPSKPVSKAVANNIQSGTFKKGGKVGYDSGGKVDVSKPVADPEATAAKARRELEDAMNPISMVKELGGKLMDKVRGKGSVTETKESVTVTPPQQRRKAGGAC